MLVGCSNMFSYYKLLPKHAESFVLLEAELTRKGT
jgi:hypothetical protein